MPHLIFLLKAMQKHIQAVEEEFAEIDAEIGHHIKDFDKGVELVQTIPGVCKDGAIGIGAEIGVDMGVFRSEHHLASHAGMCPGDNESAGKKAQEHDRGTST